MRSVDSIEEARRQMADNQFGRAIQVLELACRQHPGSGSLRLELADILSLTGRISEATELYLDLFQDGFRQAIVLASLAVSLFDEGRVPEAIASGRAAVLADPQLRLARSNLLFSLSCIDNVDPLELFKEHCVFGQLVPPPVPVRSPRLPGKTRIGFLCASFSLHPVGRFSFPVVCGLDRNRFEVYCYSSALYGDVLTKQFRGVADHWREISQLNDAQAAKLIREDDLDILVELDGHTAGNRLAVVAEKPARRTVTWLGYFNTTGISSVDHRIVDHITDPEPLSSQIHVEKLIKLEPPFVVFSKPLSAPPVSPLPALANGFVTFGAFGQVPKQSESAVDAIARVVLAVPHSRLMICASACRDLNVRDAVVKRFASRSIPVECIACGGAKGNYEYLAAHRQVDIMLDLFPFTGFTTTCESLWMGVPMVTLQGRTHRERVSSSFLTAAGYPQLIATSVDSYLRIACDLAKDIPRLAEMRTAMRGSMLRSPLMDVGAFVKRFEEALLSVVSGPDLQHNHALRVSA